METSKRPGRWGWGVASSKPASQPAASQPANSKPISTASQPASQQWGPAAEAKLASQPAVGACQLSLNKNTLISLVKQSLAYTKYDTVDRAKT